MNHPFRKYVTQLYRAGSAPIRWLCGRALAKSKRYPMGILFYHRVSDANPNPWTISTSDFEAQMKWLRDKFEIISLDEVQRRMVEGNSTPAIAITFDDGYADNCLTAIPYLIQHQIPVTYFVSTDFVRTGRPFPHDVQAGTHAPPNGIESLKLMHRSGIEIGAHSRSHRDMGKMTDPEVIFDELVVARDELEDLIECRIRYFAFPYGQRENLNDEVFRLARLYGFRGVCSAYGGLNSPGNDPFHLQRVHGDPELVCVKNWLTLDPRVLLQRSYPVPEWDFSQPVDPGVQTEQAELDGQAQLDEQAEQAGPTEQVEQVEQVESQALRADNGRPALSRHRP